MASKIALQKALEAFAKVIDEYREALVWCSGSDDFAEGGKARKGWLKCVEPLLREHEAAGAKS